LKITILGATGQIGQSTIREALKSGYQVNVLVRSPDKLGDLKNDVRVIQGDLLNTGALEEALRGSEVVLNLAGGVKEPDQTEKFKRIAQLLVEQMNKQGIKRLINISGAVTPLPGEKLELQRKIMKVFVGLFFKQMKQAQEALMPVILKADNILWTFVRPAMISKGPVTGRIITNDKKLPGSKVSLGDLSFFIVDQIRSAEWIKKAPMIASSPS
jgi:putative NADH-flavin reductase